MARILGLDVGDKRIGVALSDMGEMLATPHATFNKSEAEKKILELIDQEDIRTLVVGLPLDEKNQATKQGKKIEHFCRRIARRATVRIEYIDESYSSLEAKQRLKLTPEKEILARKEGMIDAVAASIVLQEYLDKKRET